jgi:hypothetical protein
MENQPKKKKPNKFATFKKQKPRDVQIADDLEKLHKRNEVLGKKQINTDFFDKF